MEKIKEGAMDLGRERLLVWFLAFSLVLLWIIYASLINITVSNAVAREKAESDIKNLSASVVPLEQRYIAAAGSATLDRAASFGLIPFSPDYYAKDGGEPLTFAR